jgi:hypothetical protein
MEMIVKHRSQNQVCWLFAWRGAVCHLLDSKTGYKKLVLLFLDRKVVYCPKKGTLSLEYEQDILCLCVLCDMYLLFTKMQQKATFLPSFVWVCKMQKVCNILIFIK